MIQSLAMSLSSFQWLHSMPLILWVLWQQIYAKPALHLFCPRDSRHFLPGVATNEVLQGVTGPCSGRPWYVSSRKRLGPLWNLSDHDLRNIVLAPGQFSSLVGQDRFLSVSRSHDPYHKARPRVQGRDVHPGMPLETCHVSRANRHPGAASF